MGARNGMQGPTGAAGTTRSQRGPFVVDAVAAGDNATVASATPVARLIGGAANPPEPRAGTVTGLAFALSDDPAGSSIIAYLTVNGTVQASSAQTLAAGSTRTKSGTFTGVAFTPGDVLGIATRTGSGWTATTAAFVGVLEVTQ